MTVTTGSLVFGLNLHGWGCFGHRATMASKAPPTLGMRAIGARTWDFMGASTTALAMAELALSAGEGRRKCVSSKKPGKKRIKQPGTKPKRKTPRGKK